MAQNNANTCIFSIARTPARETLFQWLQPIATTNSTFIGLADKKISLSTLEDAKDYKIAVIKDDVTHQMLLNRGFKEYEDFYIVNNTYSLLKLLVQRDSIDLILADLLTVKYRADYDGLDAQQFKPFLKLNNNPLDFYVACSHSTSQALIKRLNDGITQIKRNGDYQKIIDAQFR